MLKYPVRIAVTDGTRQIQYIILQSGRHISDYLHLHLKRTLVCILNSCRCWSFHGRQPNGIPGEVPGEVPAEEARSWALVLKGCNRGPSVKGVHFLASCTSVPLRKVTDGRPLRQVTDGTLKLDVDKKVQRHGLDLSSGLFIDCMKHWATVKDRSGVRIRIHGWKCTRTFKTFDNRRTAISEYSAVPK